MHRVHPAMSPHSSSSLASVHECLSPLWPGLQLALERSNRIGDGRMTV